MNMYVSAKRVDTISLFVLAIKKRKKKDADCLCRKERCLATHHQTGTALRDTKKGVSMWREDGAMSGSEVRGQY